MALRYGYFDSDIIGVDDEGMPIFDRAETSDLFALLFASLISDGVLARPSNCFRVRAAGSGLTIEIDPGFGMVKGHFCYDDEVAVMTIGQAPQKYTRIDRVVMRCNFLDRMVEITVKEGTESANPVPPALIRPAAGDYFELCLANIRLAPRQATLTQSSITDTRADSSVCGFITQLIDHLDTAVFFEQFNAFYAEFVEKSDTAYAKFLKDFNDRYDLFNKMAQEAYNTYANRITKYIEQIEQMALTKFTETSGKMDEYYNQITQEGQELSENYHKKMTELSDTFEKDAAKQYDKTFTLLTELSDTATEIYKKYEADTVSFYNDIVKKGNERYAEFDSEITDYIDALRNKGETRLATLTREITDWAVEHQNEFLEWFDHIKEIFKTDPSGAMQEEIDDQEKSIDLILEMLYSGSIMAPITTEDDEQLVDEEGTPIMLGEPICKCAENAAE